jgi:hypothetical protein
MPPQIPPYVILFWPCEQMHPNNSAPRLPQNVVRGPRSATSTMHQNKRKAGESERKTGPLLPTRKKMLAARHAVQLETLNQCSTGKHWQKPCSRTKARSREPFLWHPTSRTHLMAGIVTIIHLSARQCAAAAYHVRWWPRARHDKWIWARSSTRYARYCALYTRYCSLYARYCALYTRGLRHEKSSCISLTSKNCESPSSWRSLLNTWQFSLQSNEARLTVGKAQNLRRQANEKA